MLLDPRRGFAGAFLAGNVWILVELKDGDGFELAPRMVDAGDDDELIIEDGMLSRSLSTGGPSTRPISRLVSWMAISISSELATSRLRVTFG